jgi:hypothetical protein
MIPEVVSVIIPCCRGAGHLGDAVQSILAQTYAGHEIIVVDDGVTDDTQAVARQHPVRYLRQTPQGAAAARNTGLRLSQGEFLVFLDPEDRLLPEALEAGVRAALQQPECGLVYGLTAGSDPGGALAPALPSGVQASYAGQLRGETLRPLGRALFRRAAFDVVGEFDVDRAPADDYDLYLRLARVFPVHCHQQAVLAARPAQGVAEGQAARQLRGTLETLEAQWEFVRGRDDYEAAYRQGMRHWRRVFGPRLAPEVLTHLQAGHVAEAGRTFATLLRHYPQGLVRSALGPPARWAQRRRHRPGDESRPERARGRADARPPARAGERAAGRAEETAPGRSP